MELTLDLAIVSPYYTIYTTDYTLYNPYHLYWMVMKSHM